MKKNLKKVILVYVGVAVLAYVFSMRMDRLSTVEDTKNQNKAIVLKVR